MSNIRDIRITQANNFCRVFQLPDKFPRGYCFDGGLPVTFTMVDWFNPVLPDPLYYNPEGLSVEEWRQVYAHHLLEFVAHKRYVQEGKQYIIVTDFGETMMVTSKDKDNP